LTSRRRRGWTNPPHDFASASANRQKEKHPMTKKNTFKTCQSGVSPLAKFAPTLQPKRKNAHGLEQNTLIKSSNPNQRRSLGVEKTSSYHCVRVYPGWIFWNVGTLIHARRYSSDTPLFRQSPHHRWWWWWWFSYIVKRGKKTKRPIEFHAGDQSRVCKYSKATQEPQKSGFRASEDWWTFIQSIARIFFMYLE
jgi:hypothetical protein